MAAENRTFDEYWDTFVRAHAAPSLRRLSFLATSAGLGAGAAFLLTRRIAFLLLAPVVAFAPPWFARRLAGVPADLVSPQPLHFAKASLKLWHLTLIGEMEAEVARVTGSVAPDVEGADDEGDEGGELPRPNMVTDHTLH